MQREPQFGESAGDIFFAWVLAIPIFIGPGIFLFQVVGWLKSGQWPPVPLSRAFDYFGVDQPKTTWIGAQKAIDFILDLPLSIVSFILWMTVIIFVVSMLEQGRSRRRTNE